MHRGRIFYEFDLHRLWKVSAIVFLSSRSLHTSECKEDDNSHSRNERENWPASSPQKQRLGYNAVDQYQAANFHGLFSGHRLRSGNLLIFVAVAESIL